MSDARMPDLVLIGGTGGVHVLVQPSEEIKNQIMREEDLDKRLPIYEAWLKEILEGPALAKAEKELSDFLLYEISIRFHLQ